MDLLKTVDYTETIINIYMYIDVIRIYAYYSIKIRNIDVIKRRLKIIGDLYYNYKKIF